VATAVVPVLQAAVGQVMVLQSGIRTHSGQQLPLWMIFFSPGPQAMSSHMTVLQSICLSQMLQQSLSTFVNPAGHISATAGQAIAVQLGFGKHRGQHSPGGVTCTSPMMHKMAGHSIPSQG
jgi:hypothetical protein